MNTIIWPYLELSRILAKKERVGFGNMFRHQLETFGILLEKNYTDSILLKAALIHDLIEDGSEVGFSDVNKIKDIDEEGPDVYQLVMEVTVRLHDGIPEPKSIFLKRIMNEGSDKARILKLADRLSNINTLLATQDILFMKRYVRETEKIIMPYAYDIDEKIANELESSLEKLKTYYNNHE